ncbi:MerR family transcriptional regulator [Corynebacterium sp.]|uniref:MerR family transcriptional regulator n=1 Tax=Corynebacterium sp. TaxID=1720 RepID=UPI0028A694E1|nr:MerR family transcriptional regulator [Corynebacterium sp.]
MVDLRDNTVSIGELSTLTNVSVRALRYYEQHELLDAQRNGTGQRRFSPDAVETVRRIRLFLDAGLPLAIVSQVLPCFVDDGAQLHACVAEYLHDHMDTVQERIAQLDEQRDTIEQLQRLIVT